MNRPSMHSPSRTGPPLDAGLALCRPRLPPRAVAYVAHLLVGQPIQLRVTRPRRTKLGDHRPPGRGVTFHRITVNDDLNPYAFLTTLLHEIAHATSWQRHRLLGRRLAPHGREWKQEFGSILQPVVDEGIVPVTVKHALARYLLNPSARSCTDRGLVLALAEFDAPDATRIRVEDLAEETVFRADNGSLFRAGRMVRSRRQCFGIPSGSEYRVHGLVLVEPVRLAVGRAGDQDGRRQGGSGGSGRRARKSIVE